MSVTPSPERKRERGTPPDAPSKKIRLSPDADKVATPSTKVKLDFGVDDVDPDTHELDLRTTSFPTTGSDEYQVMTWRMAEAAQPKSKLTVQIGGPGAGTALSTSPQSDIHAQIFAMERVVMVLRNMQRSTTIQIEVDRRMFCQPEAAEKLYALYIEHGSEKDAVGFEDFLQVTGVEEMLQAYADDRDIAAKRMERDYNDVVGIDDSCKEMGAALRFV